MNEIDIAELRTWMYECGAVALRSFRNVVGHRKADHSWVTEADIEIERMLVERITARYPTHGILGEEQTRQGLDREFLWALDPLDGTAVFVSGLPGWGISAGLLRHGVPYFGMIYFPLLEDCYWGGPTGSAMLNDQPIHVLAPRPLDSQDWLAIPSDAHRRFTIDFDGKTRGLGSTVGPFCYVARGSALGGLISRAAIWDIAAGLAILQAAGGVAVGLSGAPINTSAMLDGRTLAEPAILAAPHQISALRGIVAQHTRPKKHPKDD
jgi:myo-inositol-1(or 4)-monophosphatase